VRSLALLALLATACVSAPAAPRVRPTSVHAHVERAAPSDPGALAERVHLRCGDDRCPEGVGLLVWADAHDDLQRCTASLIGPDLALTASHCLPRAARRAGARCDGTWLTFAATDGHPAEWVACQGVLEAEPVGDEDVLRTDLAVLRLARRVAREPLRPAFASTDRLSVVGVVAARPHPIYDTQHAISRRHCRVATPQSAAETFGPEASRVGWLVECPSHPGNSGAPVVDARGRIRAVLHAGSAPIDGIAVMSRIGGLPALVAAP